MTRCRKCDLHTEAEWFYDANYCGEPDCPLMAREARMRRACRLGQIADYLATREDRRVEQVVRRYAYGT